jgi:hypothetical protein
VRVLKICVNASRRSRRSGRCSRWHVDPRRIGAPRGAVGEACRGARQDAKGRYEREKAEHEAKLTARKAKEKATGKKPGGKPPQPPVEGAQPTDQINLTDEASRIVPVAGSSSAITDQP